MDAAEISQTIQKIKNLISEEIFVHDRQRTHENSINSLLAIIAEEFLKGYEVQREHISELLSALEEFTDHTLNILFPIFFRKLEELKQIPISKLEIASWNRNFDIDIIFQGYEPFLKTNTTPGKPVRLSFNDPVTIDKESGENFLRLIYDLLTHQSITKIKSADDVNATMLNLWMARRIARAINRPELFYLMILIFFDSLHYNENYQFARDVAEECLICSYNDNLPEYGYYLSFKVFASTSNSVTALHYGIIAITSFIKHGLINDYFIKNIYWESIKFTRNLKLIPYVIHLFENRPINVDYSEYDINKLHHAYYSSLFFIKHRQLPSLVLDHIDQYKESIIRGGEYEVLPWFAMLLNIKKNYKENEYDSLHLRRYLDHLKPMITQENYDRVYNQLFGELKNVMVDLKKSLLNLTYTRNQSDFITDNEYALGISHRTNSEAFKSENVEGYLLSMILQSDFSIVFKNKQTKLILPVHESYTTKDFDKEYYSPELLQKFLVDFSQADVLWLGTDNHKIYPLFYGRDTFQFVKDKGRNLIDAYEFTSGALEKLPHNTRTIKNAKEKFYEDYLEEEQELLKQVEFFDLPIFPQRSTLIIKDIELSSFPHNLITCNNKFIGRIVPVSNIMSLEWFIENHRTTLPVNFSKSMWIPIESGDMPVCMMHSKMDEDLLKFEFKLETKLLPDNPLESDLNIIVAHGNDKISTFPAFYLRNDTNLFTIKSFDHIVGKGKIAVLFVCHSGSEKSDLFKNQTITVVKQFLQSGYQAVIAPFWALHIDIPPIWLPVFLNHLREGHNVGRAVFEANDKVYSVYNTPKAYACLHLYGNSFLRVQSDSFPSS